MSSGVPIAELQLSVRAYDPRFGALRRPPAEGRVSTLLALGCHGKRFVAITKVIDEPGSRNAEGLERRFGTADTSTEDDQGLCRDVGCDLSEPDGRSIGRGPKQSVRAHRFGSTAERYSEMLWMDGCQG